MYPENPEGTQIFVGSMNMEYNPTLARIELTTCPVPSGSPSHYATVTDSFPTGNHFFIFSYGQGWLISGQGDPWPNAPPPKYATAFASLDALVRYLRLIG